MRVFVNAAPVEIAKGADVRTAVQAHDPDLLRKLTVGAAYVTDARGIELSADALLSEGSILRVVVSARRAAEGRDAHA
jgi:predicted secreted protein